MPGEDAIAASVSSLQRRRVMDDRRGMSNVVDAKKPAFELSQDPQTVPVRAPQKGNQASAALDATPAIHRDRRQHLELPALEGGIILLEGLVFLVEADTLEPQVEGTLGHAHDHAVGRSLLPGLEHLKETGFGRVVARVDELDLASHIRLEVFRIDAVGDENSKGFVDSPSQ